MNEPQRRTRRFRALYTKHVRQKNKVYHDGFVLLRATSVLPYLVDESGKQLAVASAAPPAEQDPSVDAQASGISLFDGFLVDLDGEVFEGEDGVQNEAEQVQQQQRQAPSSVPVCARVPAFRAPLQTRQQPQPQQQQQTFAPPRYHQQQQQSMKRRVPLSDDDILGLLSGSIEAPTAAAAAEAPAAANNNKRLRDEAKWEQERGAAAIRRTTGAAASMRWPVPGRGTGGGGNAAASASFERRQLPPPPPPSQQQQRQQQQQPQRPTPFSFLRAPPVWHCCPPPPAAASQPITALLPPLRRTVAIPDIFASPSHYASVLSAATVEELNLRLSAATRAFHACRSRVAARARSAEAAVAGAGPSAAAAPEPPPAAVEQACRSSGVAFYSRAELVVYGSAVARENKNNGGGGNSNMKFRGNGGAKARKNWGRLRQAFADEGEDDDDDDDNEKNKHDNNNKAPTSTGTFLQLHSPRERSSNYSKGDLYVLSTSSDLSPRFPSAVGDKLSAPWVAIAASKWHSPNSGGKLEVEILSCWQQEEQGNQQQQVPFACLKKTGSFRVFCLRAADAATDLSVLSCLATSSSSSPPHLLSLSRLRALPVLIAAPPSTPLYPPAATGKASAHAEAHEKAAGLNEDQRAVVEDAAAWVSSVPSSSPANPRPPAVTVIHGPFGSGKSALLVALVAFLANKKREEQEEAEKDDGGGGKERRLPPGSGLRVLVVSHTNAAVDRVLTGLLESGFDDIIRVGPLRRMNRALLPYSLHAAASAALSTTTSSSSSTPSASLSTAAATANATAELQAMLRDATAAVSKRKSLGGAINSSAAAAAAAAAASAQLSKEASAIAAELARVKAGAVRARAAALCRAAVVGTTCVSASALPAMLAASEAEASAPLSTRGKGDKSTRQQRQLRPTSRLFDVAVVDEASQISEPLAAAALAASGASYVVVAGDPAQLPPVVASPAAVSSTTSSSTSSKQRHGLARSLLSRLIDAGHGARILRTQYRCHPVISSVANECFYSGKLRDGVTELQRPPLVPWLPPLALADVRSGASEEFDGNRANGGGGSIKNRAEAAAVVRLVGRLRASGVRAESVGVICFFRAQVELVRRLLLESVVSGAASSSSAAAETAKEQASEGEQEHEEERDDGGEEERDGGGEGERDGGGEGEQDPLEIPTVATVDSYQGCEKDVIVVTTAATRPSPFTRDAARVNVAITRAKRHLIVVGHGGALTQASGAGRTTPNALGMIVRQCLSTPGGVLEMV